MDEHFQLTNLVVKLLIFTKMCCKEIGIFRDIQEYSGIFSNYSEIIIK